MTHFTITDSSAKHSKSESFLTERFTICSRSGLHPTEAMIINNLEVLRKCGSVLITGNRTGAAAMVASVVFPESAITCHTHDLHHAAAIIRNLHRNRRHAKFVTEKYVECAKVSPTATATSSSIDPRFTVACTSGLPSATFDNALLMFTPDTMSGELALDVVENSAQALKPGGQAMIAYDGESSAFIKQLKKIFSGVKILTQSRKSALILCSIAENPSATRDFSARFTASLPAEDVLTLVSLPGVFCHRRADQGGLALAEVAAPLIHSKMKVLDFGCGCGMVGLLLAHKSSQVSVTFVDSSIRALEATRRNTEACKIQDTRLILSDTGIKESGYDLFAGNPPYYSDYRIAALFIEQAVKALKSGGTALLVAKTADKIETMMHRAFGNAESVRRRGYSVVIARKR